VTHAGLVEEALSAGAHLIVEKPLAPDGPATERLLALATRAGVLLCPVHQYLFQPGTRAATGGVARIAPLLHVESTACSAGGRGSGQTLDGTADDILPHPLSVFERLLPGGIGGAQWHATRPREGEIRAVANREGTSISLCISMNGRPPRNELVAIGARGTIHLDFFHGYWVLERSSVSRLQKALHPFSLSGRRSAAAALNLGLRAAQREPAYPGLRALIASFYDAMRAGRAAPIEPAEVLAVATERDAILAATGRA
jgi:predicted dehydrogenase